MCRGADQMRVFEQFQQTCINGVDVDELLAIARSASCGFESCQAHKMADPTASDGVYPITSADGTSCERERADSLGLAWLPLHYLESLELRTALLFVPTDMAFCDMTTSGGGWELVLRASSSASVFTCVYLYAPSSQ